MLSGKVVGVLSLITFQIEGWAGTCALFDSLVVVLRVLPPNFLGGGLVCGSRGSQPDDPYFAS